jgi:DNA repair protein RadC
MTAAGVDEKARQTSGAARGAKRILPAGRPSPALSAQGHRRRLKERFLAGGLEGFHDYEVIELLLTLNTPRRDCKAAAKLAMERFKTLQAVLEASSHDLCQIEGIGPQSLLGLKLVKAVAERYQKQRLLGKTVIGNSADLLAYLSHAIRDKARECFVALFLDAKNRVLAADTLFTGTLTASSVYPREVVQSALSHQAAALIFAHNHPSGDTQPSAADMAVTRQLVFAARVVGITVHEHLIIGSSGHFSFADHGHIARMHQEFEQHGM